VISLQNKGIRRFQTCVNVEALDPSAAVISFFAKIIQRFKDDGRRRQTNQSGGD
jgi:hypothetical protein